MVIWRSRLIAPLGKMALLGIIALLAADACRADQVPAPPPVTPASLPASAPSAAPPLATIVAQRGLVEVQRKEEGQWRRVANGDRLDVADAIRTSEDGEVDIAVNEVRLRIHERSEFTVKKLSDSVIRGRLTGRLESEVAAGKGEVEVDAAGSNTSVRTQGGHFSMISNGRGIVAVANIAGEVKVQANGKSLALKAGEVSHVTGNAAPTTNRALRNVLLAVAWPAEKITNHSTVSLSGKVEVGTRLVVAGRKVEADAAGNWNAQVPLKSGTQTLAVLAVDVLGRKKRLSTEMTHDANAPHVRMKDRLWH